MDTSEKEAFLERNKSNMKRKYHAINSPQKEKKQEAYKKSKSTKHNLDYFICNFQNKIREGPCYICCVCNRLLYKKSVKLLNRNSCNSTVPKFVFTNITSFGNKEYICSTCHSKVAKGKIPCQAVYNDISVDEIPVELALLEKLDQIVIAQRIVFEKIIIMPKGQQKKVSGAICNVPVDCESLRVGVPWSWCDKQQEAFDKIKVAITTAPVLQFYDVQKEVTLTCDASNHGLGAACLQDGKPVAYASQALSATQKRYAQIEKELLAVTPIAPLKMDELKKETASDPVLAKLITTINNGWHESLKETDPDLQVFFNFREQLIVQYDIVFKGEKIVVPSTLRSDYLNQIHQGYPGLEAMKNRVCDIFYWPALSRDVEVLLSQCSVCNAYRRHKQKEPLKIHEVPVQPWSVVASNLFIWNGTDYLITADSYSGWFELNTLSTGTSSRIVIQIVFRDLEYQTNYLQIMALSMQVWILRSSPMNGVSSTKPAVLDFPKAMA